MYKRYIILFILCVFLVLSSCVKLEHSNPVDPEYKDKEDTGETRNQSVIPPYTTDTFGYKYYLSELE